MQPSQGFKYGETKGKAVLELEDSVLHYALMLQKVDVKKINKLLAENKIYTINRNRKTPFHCAIETNNFQIDGLI